MLDSILNKYFNHPVLIDSIIGLLVNSGLWTLYKKGIICFPETSVDTSISTDVSTIALTLAGFVLTLLTVLITFKAAAKIPDPNDLTATSIFDRFFSSDFYGQTIDLLKGAIAMLIFVSILGFVLKLTLRDDAINYLFFSNSFGLLIIVTTLFRCLFILDQIVKLQQG